MMRRTCVRSSWRIGAALGSRRGLCSGSSSSSEDASRRAATRATEFGFRTVPEQDKERLVGNVFHSVASKYDIMNDFMSVGLHRVWKNTMVEMIGLRGMGRSDLQVLDVAGGTGDVAFRIADQMGSLGQAPVSSGAEDELEPEAPRVVVVDINKSMLETGRKRFAADQRVHPSRPHMDWVHASAEQLPFDDCSFDVYTVAFGIRNVTHIEDALREAHRVLRPGGRFLCLEFSHVTHPVLAKLYEQYSFHVIPRVGGLVADDRASYQYLVESIQKFHTQDELARLIRQAGFRFVSHTNLTAGIVAVHSGMKLS